MSSEESLLRCPVCQETSPQGYLLCPFCGADLLATYESKVFVPVTYKESWKRIFQLFKNPIAISKEIADNPDSKPILFFILIIAFGFAFQVFSLLVHNFLFSWRVVVIFLVVFVASMLLPTIAWMVASLLIRILARLLGGKANKKQIRSAVAYGFMPLAIGQLFNGLFYLIALPWNRTDIFSFDEVFNTMFQFRNSFAGIFGLIINILSFLATGVFIVFIVKPSSEFSWVEAAIATGIPVLFFTVLMITYYFAA